jgi:hypothetical protein
MINIEFGPSTILGVIILFESIMLYLIRTLKPNLAKDYDIFFSSLGLLAGGILIFQGWRLDPILLFGQMLSSGTAMFFILESLQLRSLNQKSHISTLNVDFLKEFSENIPTKKKKRKEILDELPIKQDKKIKDNLSYTSPIDYSNDIYQQD